ncbi:helix-turn-helix domain-containing protein [Flavobacterium sp.]|jgi:transcriptional regulator with XRE-family HTH domain|uniref:helix-turn-helix domain-containing protein n=1 Tax=Flavobacterium sp. TaxID=239 RepID=UPI0037C01C11
MNIGKNIKQYRELKNITQEHMATFLDISQSTYAKIENGQVTPKIERLQQISKILEVDLSTLLNTSNNLTFNFQKEAYYSGYINNQHIELRETYEKLIASKDEQIALLKSLLENK